MDSSTILNSRGQPLKSRPAKITLVAGALLLAIGAASLARLISESGLTIPPNNMDADYLAALGWAVVLGASIFLWPVSREDKKALLLLWAARCFVVLGLMLLYEWHYVAVLDAWAYFSDGNIPNAPLIPTPFDFGNGMAAVRALSTASARLVPHSYNATKLTFSMVGLIAVYFIYRAAVRFDGRENRRLLYLLGLFPSIIFWSSILGKDPLQILGIAIYLYGVVALVRTGAWPYLIVIGIGVALAMAIRLWTGPILFLPLGVLLLSHQITRARRLIALGLYVAALLVGVSRLSTAFRVQSTDDVLALAGSLANGWQGGSEIGEGTVSYVNDPWMAVRHAPGGAFTALFRPLPGEVLNPFGLVAGLESAFLLFLLFRGFGRLRKEVFREPLVAWAALLILTWAVVYGFVAYNLGAMVRFRLQVLPLMLLLFLYVQRSPKTELSDQPSPGV